MKYIFEFPKSIRIPLPTIQCKPEYAILLFATLDLSLCIPATGYHIIKTTSSEEWLATNRDLALLTHIHMVSAAVLGIVAIGVLRCLAKVQTVITIIERLWSIMLLYLLKSEESGSFFSITIWFATSFGILQIMSDAVSSSIHDKSTITEKSKLRMFITTWIPGLIIITISSIVINFLEDEKFELRYYILYTLGFELLITISYYSLIISMGSKKNDCSKDGKNDNREDSEVIKCSGNEENVNLNQDLV